MENEKIKLGRPTKYREEFIDKVDEYLEQCVDGYKEVLKTRQTIDDDGRVKEVITNELVKKVNLPTIEGFANYISVHKDTLQERRKEYPFFSVSLDKIINEQKKRVLENGLSGDYNSTIAKLILSHNHGMKETTVTENTGKDGGVIEQSISIKIITPE